MIGVDISTGMLKIAKKKVSEGIKSGKVKLFRKNATSFRLKNKMEACISLEGSLNHIESVEDMEQCFKSVYKALNPGRVFLFDLYTLEHFLHWNNVVLMDEANTFIAKRGVWDDWDEKLNKGTLRISGFLEHGSRLIKIQQNLHSRFFSEREINEVLYKVGFKRIPCNVSFSQEGMIPESKMINKVNRTLYAAIKE